MSASQSSAGAVLLPGTSAAEAMLDLPANPALPDWFSRLQQQAAKAYVETELPGYGNEAWHYGDPRRFQLEDLRFGTDSSQPGVRFNELQQLACMHEGATRASWRAGQFTLQDLNHCDAQSGVQLLSLADVGTQSSTHNWEQYWAGQSARVSHDKLYAAHYALASSPVVLYIPRGVETSGPIFLNIQPGGPGCASAPQILVVADSGSRAELCLTVTSDNAEERQLILASTRCVVETGASLKLIRVQHLGDRTDCLTWEAASLAGDATYQSVNVLFGGRTVRLEAFADLRARGATAHLYGAVVARGRQRYDFLTHQNHIAPHANSNLLYKSALLDKSRVSYQGTITVHPGAQKTDAYQKNRSLVLSPQARSDSSPQLEIKADDVRCSHGSTTSNVSPAELFYLRSRGINEHDARQLLVHGFLGEVLAQLPSAALREYVNARVLERL